MSYAFTLLLLTLAYLLTLASFDPWDVAIGALLAAGVLAWSRRALPASGRTGAGLLLRRIAAFPLFAAAIVREVVTGTWQVSLIVLGLRPLARPGIVAVPIGERTPTGVAATALALTLSPGEVLVDIDDRSQVMLVHVVDASDPDAVRARHDEFYRRYQQGVFP
ncbi:MAG TPA: Na+/H+ antiporter subunit E [Solirubrobacteraceae bacterium]|jgi:multicomponent Na+:H+ antiporter subunit E|nr:Na+/H+ antiporter subunit E [Solirubrobacteraceae bacterium]